MWLVFLLMKQKEGQRGRNYLQSKNGLYINSRLGRTNGLMFMPFIKNKRGPVAQSDRAQDS